MGRIRLAPSLLIGLCCATSTGAAQTTLSSRELHERIIAVYGSRTTRPLPAGDTLVSWYGNPVLFHTVARTKDSTASGMVRADSLLGTATVYWSAGHPKRVAVHWSRGDVTEAALSIAVTSDSIVIEGTRSASWLLPTHPWGIADYGMEDLLVPVLSTLGPGLETVLAFRPFPFKWDTLQVSSTKIGEGRLYELRSSTGKKDWWLVSATGALLQVRREGQDFERRPLEETELFAEYQRMRTQLLRDTVPQLPSNEAMERSGARRVSGVARVSTEPRRRK